MATHWFGKADETFFSRSVKEVKIPTEIFVQQKQRGSRSGVGGDIAQLGCAAVLRYDKVICMMARHWLLAGLRVINMGC